MIRKLLIDRVFQLAIFIGYLIQVTICQVQADQLYGNLLQTGEIIITKIDPLQQIVYQFKQNITQEYYNIVLSLKRVDYSQSCDENYEFKMQVLEKGADKFILQIKQYKCLNRVDIQWFAHSYQQSNNTFISYFKQQIYEKNIMFSGQKQLKQTYIFDSKQRNRKIISLFTGFELPPYTRIESIILSESQHQSWRNSVNYDTLLNLTQLNGSNKLKPIKASFSMSFLITHPNIFECQKKLQQSLQIDDHIIALQNIQFLDTTLSQQEGEKQICYFRQYDPTQLQGQSQQEFIPYVNSKKQYLNNNLVDVEQDDKNPNNNEEDKHNNKSSEKDEEDKSGKDKTTDNKVDPKSVNENQRNDDVQDFQQIYLIAVVILLSGGLIIGIYKYYKKQRQQFIPYQNQENQEMEESDN